MEHRNRQTSTESWTPFIAAGVVLVAAAAAVLLAAQFLQLRCVGYAPQTTCRNNLLQLGLAFGSYVSDYDGRLPDSGKWPQQVLPYCKTVGIQTCPKSSRRSGMHLKIDGHDARITYSMNVRLKGLSTHDVNRRDETVLLFDSTGARLAGGPELLPTEVRHTHEVTGATPCPVINVLFADWHVEEIPVESVPKLKWDPK